MIRIDRLQVAGKLTDVTLTLMRALAGQAPIDGGTATIWRDAGGNS